MLTLADPNPHPKTPAGRGKPPLAGIGGSVGGVCLAKGAGTLGVVDGGKPALVGAVEAVLTSS